MTPEKLSKGEAIHRRKVLAQERKQIPPPPTRELSPLQARIRERRCEIEEMLGRNNLDPKQRADFTIEDIWWEFRLSENEERRRATWQKYLNKLNEENPEVHDWLISKEGPNGTTVLAQIRDRVIPPKTVGGYYTKR